MRKLLRFFIEIFTGRVFIDDIRFRAFCKALLAKTGIGIILLMGFSHFGFSQTYIDVYVDQPAPLKANAGADTAIHQGDTIQLGGSPSAEGGNGGYAPSLKSFSYGLYGTGGMITKLPFCPFSNRFSSSR